MHGYAETSACTPARIPCQGPARIADHGPSAPDGTETERPLVTCPHAREGLGVMGGNVSTAMDSIRVALTAQGPCAFPHPRWAWLPLHARTLKQLKAAPPVEHHHEAQRAITVAASAQANLRARCIETPEDNIFSRPEEDAQCYV